jgi:tetratricopeptide (TPR) repeat protein
MTEALITELSKIGSLRVISRQSVMRYKGSDTPLPDIAQVLSVDTIVEGSVLIIGDQVRINAKLIETEKDRHIWAKTYDRNISNILALHSEVARAIADEIKIAVTPEEESRLKSAPVVNPEAYEAYLMGRRYLGENVEGTVKAVEYFERACEIDSTFALGYAGLAEAHAWLIGESGFPPEDTWPKVRLAAEKALVMDEGLSEAHSALALVKFMNEHDWHEAEKEFTQALNLNPNNANARNMYSWFLSAMERHDEAIKQTEIALRLNPLSLYIQYNAGFILSAAGHYEEGQRILSNIIDSNPEVFLAFFNLTANYALQEMYEEAVFLLHAAKDSLGDISTWPPYGISILGYLYGRLGRTAEARRMLELLDELASRGIYFDPAPKSWIYIALNEKDKAFELLEQGYKMRSMWMCYIKVDPFYDSLRDDPRFQDLLRRMNFPD